MLCLNPRCPDRLRDGTPADYRAGFERCPRCDTVLVDPPTRPIVGPWPAAAEAMEHVPMRAIASFEGPSAAHIVRGRLECEGIRAAVADEHLVGLNWFYSNAVGGVKVLVPEVDARRAREILAREDSASEDEIDFGPEAVHAEPETCPRCGSCSVLRQIIRRSAVISFFLSHLLGIPLVRMKHGWRCEACGNVWTRWTAH